VASEEKRSGLSIQTLLISSLAAVAAAVVGAGEWAGGAPAARPPGGPPVAGLRRLGRESEITETLSSDAVLPAPGQGALAIECAASDADLAAQLAGLDDPHTRMAVTAERTLLATLEAGCSAPVAALADLQSDGQNATVLRLRGAVGTADGSALVQLSTTGPVTSSVEEGMTQAAAMGRDLAEEMLAKGAAGLMGERAH
jgi:hydroxymethylbilane synthase